MKKKPSKKRNPQDSTRRNIAASRRRDAQLLGRIIKLEQKMLQLDGWIKALTDDLDRLVRRVEVLEDRK